ncbi:MAG TPA: Smr/MutS family protein [Candidatus Binatia bacterium]|nr:Smr/MutS family protein [Candidatus Binatia bacterium]
MSRRGRPSDRKRGRQDAAAARPPALNAPFADLGKRVRARAAALPPPSRVAPPSPRAERPEAGDERSLFAHAMAGVVPLPRGGDRVDGPPPATGRRRPVSDEAEALAALSDLVSGAQRFDVSDTREYVEGAIVGLDPRVLRRLRRGDFAWQAHLDLHGMTAEAARPAVGAFLTAAVRAGHRCVLIVHGRGLNSKDQVPVLKERIKEWLARGSAARIVLAFTTARPCDGGSGALYVLLRRDRRRRPIEVIEGAKR